MINLEREIREQPEVLARVIGMNRDTAEKIVSEAKKRDVCGI